MLLGWCLCEKELPVILLRLSCLLTFELREVKSEALLFAYSRMHLAYLLLSGTSQ